MSPVSPLVDLHDMLRRLERCEQRQRTIGCLLLAILVCGAFVATRTPAISQTSTQLQAEISALQNTLKFVTTTGADMVISGANLHIVNGSGSTGNENGLGNLIVGYNALRNDTPGTDVRTGSHNLILGDQNSYSSYAGIVAGRHNTIASTFACVQGGFGNTASGAYSNVCGGNGNIASATYSFVGGGEVNTASGLGSSVNGGQANKATGQSSSVNGGLSNTVTGNFAVALGGHSNSTSVQYDIVPLSTNSVISAQFTSLSSSMNAINNSISGINTSLGTINTTLTSDATIINYLLALGDTYNNEITALQVQTRYISAGQDKYGYPATFFRACNVWVQDGSGSTSDNGDALTGVGNLIIGYNEDSGGLNANGDLHSGSHNLIVGLGNSYNSFAGVVFGLYNSVLDSFASVTGGDFNTVSNHSASISGGSSNTASGFAASVSGGDNNSASGGYSSITGGSNNVAIGGAASVSGGYLNSAVGGSASILGAYSLRSIQTTGTLRRECRLMEESPAPQ
jgi:hypothetical protein